MRRTPEHVIRELTLQLESLRLEVAGTEKALAALSNNTSVPAPLLRRTKSDYLREYLKDNLEGVRVSRVNEIIAARGYRGRSRNPQYNWLYQDREAKRWFAINDGIVTLQANASEPRDKTEPSSATHAFSGRSTEEMTAPQFGRLERQGERVQVKVNDRSQNHR